MPDMSAHISYSKLASETPETTLAQVVRGSIVLGLGLHEVVRAALTLARSQAQNALDGRVQSGGLERLRKILVGP